MLGLAAEGRRTGRDGAGRAGWNINNIFHASPARMLHQAKLRPGRPLLQLPPISRHSHSAPGIKRFICFSYFQQPINLTVIISCHWSWVGIEEEMLGGGMCARVCVCVGGVHVCICMFCLQNKRHMCRKKGKRAQWMQRRWLCVTSLKLNKREKETERQRLRKGKRKRRYRDRERER